VAEDRQSTGMINTLEDVMTKLEEEVDYIRSGGVTEEYDKGYMAGVKLALSYLSRVHD